MPVSTKPAPVVLFCYNRPAHTEECLTALRENDLASESVLYVYSDGPKENASQEERDLIRQTRDVIRKSKWCKDVIIIESEKNMGLAASVIRGVTEVAERHGTVIVLEDDVITSKFFLKFMNDALTRYLDQGNVFMISGYNFPINEFEKKGESFFLPLITTWGWATWKRAWDNFDENATGYEELKTNLQLRNKFNLDNAYNYTDMLIQQMESNSISSWGIRWWWSVFKMNGLGLYPDNSLVKNIGWDGSGRHSTASNVFYDAGWRSDYEIHIFPSVAEVDYQKFGLIKNYLRAKFSPPEVLSKSTETLSLFKRLFGRKRR